MRTTNRPRLRWWPSAVTAAALVTWAVLTATVVPEPGGHRELTGREWQQIAADPAAHAGERIVVFGVVTRTGAGTRPDLLRAAVDSLDRSDPAGYSTGAELEGAAPAPEAGDTFRAEVTVRAPEAGLLVLDVDRLLVLDRAG
jgi:hypothetical protein